MVTIPPEDDDLKISEMPLRNKLILTDQFPLIAGGKNYRAPLSQIKDLAVEGPPGPIGPVGPMGAIAQYVPDIAAMRALPQLAVGHIIYVGARADQFVVVDDPTLSTDGGTVFIPDSELSAVVSEAIPPTYFVDATGANCTKEYSLAHIGIDFESVECVLSDPNATFPSGETIDIWRLHGHVYSPGYLERGDPTSPGFSPQLPLIDTGRGKFRDPIGNLTTFRGSPPSTIHPPVRTGGVLVRYKYATSGLRLKRITGLTFQLNWWPVVAVDEEAPGTQTDNSGKIAWCANAAAKAGAEVVLIDKMYHYGRLVEWPDGIEMRGRGPGLSGFRVMDNAAYKELKLTSSSDYPAADPAVNPMNKPATRMWAYDSSYLSNSCTFFPATGVHRMKIRGIEFNGNIENNMRFWSQGNTEYAYSWASSTFYYGNTTTYGGLVVGNAGNRVISPNCTVELLGHVKISGYGHTFLGNVNARFIQTGMLEVGNCIAGHLLYQCQGEYEHLRTFGYFYNDGIRAEKFVAKTVEHYATPMPDVMFDLPMISQFYISLGGGPQVHSASHLYPYPQPDPSRVVIENLFIDATGMDNWPAGKTYQQFFVASLGNDNIHIRSGRIRYGSKSPSVVNVFTGTLNLPAGLPVRNQLIENLQIEYGSRTGIALWSQGYGPAQRTFRDITIEPRAATHIPGNPAPSGSSVLLGSYAFSEPIPPAIGFYDGWDIDFSAATAAGLSGDWIDILPSDVGAPTYRLWFNYNAGSTAPSGSGVTLVPVAIVTADTPATTAVKFSAAIAGTVASPAVPSVHLTAATFNTKSAIGSFSNYHHEVGYGFPTVDVTNATGVTKIERTYRRNYEPFTITCERLIAADPIYIYLLAFTANTMGPHPDVYIRFKECVLGAYTTSFISLGGTGTFAVPEALVIRDKIHCVFADTIFDCRDPSSWQGLDLFLYVSKFRNCLVRTPSVATGLTSMGTGYETLFSEQSGVYTVTPGADASSTANWIDIQTKLFWLPKEGNVRIYPADAATAVVWNTNMPYVEWRKSARPVSLTSAALLDDEYYQGSATPSAINEDRRAPVLRLNFASALAASPLKIGWSAAVSP